MSDKYHNSGRELERHAGGAESDIRLQAVVDYAREAGSAVAVLAESAVRSDGHPALLGRQAVSKETEEAAREEVGDRYDDQLAA